MDKKIKIKSEMIIKKTKEIVDSISKDEDFLGTLLSLTSGLFDVCIKSFSIIYEKDDAYSREKLLNQFNKIVNKNKNKENSNIIFDFTNIKNN